MLSVEGSLGVGKHLVYAHHDSPYHDQRGPVQEELDYGSDCLHRAEVISELFCLEIIVKHLVRFEICRLNR